MNLSLQIKKIQRILVSIKFVAKIVFFNYGILNTQQSKIWTCRFCLLHSLIFMPLVRMIEAHCFILSVCLFVCLSNVKSCIPTTCKPLLHYWRAHWTNVVPLFKEWVSFFWVHGEWIVARDKQIAWTARRFSADLFVPRYDSFPMNPEKKTLIPYIYNASNQGPFLNLSEKNYKFKIPTVTGS